MKKKKASKCTLRLQKDMLRLLSERQIAGLVGGDGANDPGTNAPTIKPCMTQGGCGSD